VGDCLHEPSDNQEMEASHASYWKVDCSAPNAQWKIAAMQPAPYSIGSQFCNTKMVGKPEWGSASGTNGQDLDSDHGEFCLLHQPKFVNNF
jgi:hypothetical protein